MSTNSETTLPQFRAGPFTLRYDAGTLRYVRIGSHEVLRMVYWALRDEHWGTYNAVIDQTHTEQESDSFAIRFVARHVHEGQSLMRWECTITGSASGQIEYDLRGTVLQPFWKNRAGLCVLHPLDECCGQPCDVVHPYGSLSRTAFPTWISPHQPFRQVVGMKWPLPTGEVAELLLDGEVFETEDQRNWTDASFKTYSTPLEEPFPVQLQEGHRVHHRLTLRLTTATDLEWVATQAPHDLPHKQKGVELGTMLSSTINRPLSETECTALRRLSLDYYQATIWLDDTDWRFKLYRATHDAQRLGVPLDLSLCFGQTAGPQVEAFVDEVRQLQAPIGWLMPVRASSFVSDDTLLAAVLPALRAHFPAAAIGGGSELFFAELNRNRFSTQGIDFVGFTLNPQVHAFDDLTLHENLAAQAHALRAARHYFADLPVRVVVSLRLRYDPATRGQPEALKNDLPQSVDPRQRTSFAAEWTAQSLRILTEAGVSAVAYYEAVGCKGILMGETESPDIQHFPAERGDVFPVFEVLRKAIRT